MIQRPSLIVIGFSQFGNGPTPPPHQVTIHTDTLEALGRGAVDAANLIDDFRRLLFSIGEQLAAAEDRRREQED